MMQIAAEDEVLVQLWPHEDGLPGQWGLHGIRGTHRLVENQRWRSTVAEVSHC